MLVWKFGRSGQTLVELRESFGLLWKYRKFFLEFDFLYVIIQIHRTDAELRFMPVCLKITDLTTSPMLDRQTEFIHRLE